MHPGSEIQEGKNLTTTFTNQSLVNRLSDLWLQAYLHTNPNIAMNVSQLSPITLQIATMLSPITMSSEIHCSELCIVSGQPVKECLCRYASE